MRFWIFFLILFLGINFTGCSLQDKDKKIKELSQKNKQLVLKINQLENENKKLKEKLDQLMNAPARLKALAKNHIEKKEGAKAKTLLVSLINSHPEEKYNKDTKHLLMLAEKLIKKEIERKKKLEKEKKRLIEKYMYIDKDDIENIIWYMPKDALYNTEDFSMIYAYIGQKASGGKPWLRIVVQYVNDDWLFVKKFVILADGKRYEYIKDFKRKVLKNSNRIREKVDFYAEDSDIEMLKSLAKAKDRKVRFYGSDSYDDPYVYFSIEDTLKVYEQLMHQYDHK